MDGNEMKDLRELIEFLKSQDIAEFDLEQADLKVRLKFASAVTASAPAAGGLDMAQIAQLMASASAGAPALAAPAHVGACASGCCGGSCCGSGGGGE